MSFRQFVNRNPSIMIGVVVVVVLVAGYVLYSQFAPRGSGAVGGNKAYYSVDDGKTFFADSRDKIPPFDYNGQEAVRADVVKCGDGEPYVAYLYKYQAKYKQVLEQVRTDPSQVAPADRPLMVTADSAGMLRKKPGEKNWAPYNAMGNPTIAVKCPDGNNAVVVRP